MGNKLERVETFEMPSVSSCPKGHEGAHGEVRGEPLLSKDSSDKPRWKRGSGKLLFPD